MQQDILSSQEALMGCASDVKVKFPGQQLTVRLPIPEGAPCDCPFTCSHVKDPVEVETTEDPKPSGVLRLRKRGRATRSLQRVGETLPGWWRDLTGKSGARAALSWFESHHQDSGVKAGLTRSVPAVVVDDVAQPDVTMLQVHFSSEEGRRWLWVCPELIAELHLVRLFRPIGEGLLASLRSRSRLWAKQRGLSVMDLSRVLAGSLVLAALPQPDEVVALGALRGSAGQWSTDVLGALSKGRAQPTTRGGSWWDVLRPAFRFGNGLKGTTLGGEGCPAITMAQ